jgi:hypothetical protein
MSNKSNPTVATVKKRNRATSSGHIDQVAHATADDPQLLLLVLA